ncbi:zinc finger protein 26-like [Ornithodoros turicata]|uniref:zinc finger protein 26-like n=1 Tax=Ornithodoros turicata TaxID=34597 RepID=UPI003139E70A
MNRIRDVVAALGNKCIVCHEEQECVNFMEHMKSHNPFVPTSVYLKHSHLPNGLYQCIVCGKQSTRKAFLRPHYITHVKETPFKCPKCSFAFKTANRFSDHFIGAHLDGPPLGCPECPFWTKRPRALRKHLARHSGRARERCEVCFKWLDVSSIKQHYFLHTDEKPFQCSECSEGYSAKGALLRHIKKVHSGRRQPDETLMSEERENTDAVVSMQLEAVTGCQVMAALGNKCIVCDTVLSHGSNIWKHMKGHDPELPGRQANGTYECAVCGIQLKSTRRFITHCSTHTEERPFKCPKCPSASRTAQHFRDHFRKTHLPKPKLKCPKCNFTTKWRVSLNKHQLLLHSDKDTRECCEVCFKMITPHFLKSHYFRHTGERPYKCRTCSRGYTTVEYLKVHNKRVHLGIKRVRKRATCNVCHKSLPRSSFLVAHMRRHTDEPTNTCCICSKSFYQVSEYVSHMSRVHIGEKNCECQVCGKGFHSSTELNVHMVVHTEEKRFKCPVCEKAFAWKHKIGDHMKTHSEERPFKCNLCGEAFKWKHNLSNHVRAKHT